ncbi:MFS transporter [Actinocorallia herbida]|nr:MFS transporter [Actinocorallia herbida]
MKPFSALLAVLGVGMLSATVVSVALPQIIGDLGGTQSQYTWVVTAALLATTATTPLWGRLADLFDKKMLLQVGIVLFAVSSIACGLAQNTEQLIAFRAIQGVGMGAVQILVQVVIAALIPPRERGKYNGYLGGVMALATVGGPLIGGLIADSPLGWRWCFFIMLPFLAIASFVLRLSLHIERVKQTNVKIDFLGAALIAAGVSLLLIWVTFVGDEYAWLSWQTAVMVGGTVVILALAVRAESRASHPVVPLHIVTQRTPALAIVASLAVGMAMFGGAVFLGQYFQIGRGYSPTEAGLLTFPMMLGVLVSSAVSGRIISKTGNVRPHVVTGLVVLLVGFIGMSTMDHQTALVLLGVFMALIGVGVGMSMQNLVLIVQNGVSMKDMGAASGAMTFFRSLGGAMGVSILGAVLASNVASSIKEGLTKAGIPVTGEQGGSLNIAEMPEPIKEIVRAAYGDATGHIFLVSAGVAVIGLIATLFLRPPALRETFELPEELEAAGEAKAAAAGLAGAADLTAEIEAKGGSAKAEA